MSCVEVWWDKVTTMDVGQRQDLQSLEGWRGDMTCVEIGCSTLIKDIRKDLTTSTESKKRALTFKKESSQVFKVVSTYLGLWGVLICFMI